jgi:CheY-like chemotaxis protein
MKVLFVEDHRDLIDTMALIAQGFGHQTSCAYDGKTGVMFASQTIFDVIVLDMTLPDATGGQVCNDIRRGPSHQARIVALSGQLGFEKKFDVSGFDMCFRKPIGIDIFEQIFCTQSHGPLPRRKGSLKAGVQ